MCREACINFKELCKKKLGDGLWIEELAAMEAYSPAELSFSGTSGIVLTNETSVPNQNVLLNFTNNLAPNESSDVSKSDSTTSNASSESKKGTSYIFHSFFLVAQLLQVLKGRQGTCNMLDASPSVVKIFSLPMYKCAKKKIKEIVLNYISEICMCISLYLQAVTIKKNVQ